MRERVTIGAYEAMHPTRVGRNICEKLPHVTLINQQDSGENQGVHVPRTMSKVVFELKDQDKGVFLVSLSLYRPIHMQHIVE